MLTTHGSTPPLNGYLNGSGALQHLVDAKSEAEFT